MAKTKKASTKKSTAQTIVSYATFAMPEPIRKIVGSRIGAPLTLLVAGLLIASGVLTIQWDNGKPSVSIDKERAQEVEHNLEVRAEAFKHKLEDRLENAQQKPQTGFFR